MNKILLFLVCFGFETLAFAQSTRLIFYSENGETFQIEMDGKMYNEIPSYYIKFDAVSPGKHLFTLSFSEKGALPIKRVFSPKPGWEYTYLIQKKTGQNLRSSVQFRGQNYQISGLFVWAENSIFAIRQISGINLGSEGADAFTPASSGENVVNGSQTGSQPTQNNYSGGSGATFNYGAAQGYSSASGYAGPSGTTLPCSKASDGPEFEKAISKIRDNGGKSEQKAGIKAFLTLNCVNSAQARNLISEFATETDRLEIAKFAWHRTLDQVNYFVVFDSFSDPSSIDSLKEYMKENP